MPVGDHRHRLCVRALHLVQCRLVLRGVGGEGGLELRDARAKRVALRVHGADERVVFVLLLELLLLLLLELILLELSLLLFLLLKLVGAIARRLGAATGLFDTLHHLGSRCSSRRLFRVSFRLSLSESVRVHGRGDRLLERNLARHALLFRLDQFGVHAHTLLFRALCGRACARVCVRVWEEAVPDG